ncbi:isoprenoid synthase domain-containing protein [Stachybotrys elegans]|uniref:Terpene synthase n=1 Tax=Stachybotrys elegans TaxID=80388 RepID=A0A8K0SVN5_9HYPO|nr:isoprenoid synthase domain-containing protein [Stachybotrys elegans]
MAQTSEHSHVVLSPPVDKRDELLLKIRGQTAHLPDLRPIFQDWKGISHRHVSPWLEPLRDTVNQKIQSLSFSTEKQKRLERTDFALFTALWWPDTSPECLETLAYLVIWLFTWDDEIDEPSGAYSESLSGAQTYRDQTLRFVNSCLGLTDTAQGEHDLKPQSHIVQSFDVIGYALRSFYNESQLRRFGDEIERFMRASEVEQLGRLRGEIPTLDEYWSFRLGTSAVYIGSAVGEYSMAAHLPLHVMNSSAMCALWDETNIIISITNDLLSLRKEIKLGCLDSIVPLTFATTMDMNEAMALSVAALQASKKRFDEAARELLSEEPRLEPEVQEKIREFIEIQRSNCVGNLIWSLETKRYDVSGVRNNDQSIDFSL